MHPNFNDKLVENDPGAFFGLSGAWTKTDLKRAYAASIRQWKPEKFPEEFKRVRSAYERLLSDVPAPESTPPATVVSSSEIFTATLRDTRPASEILAAESPEAALSILETRVPANVAESLALARLRFPGDAWPRYDIATLAKAIVAAGTDTNLGPIVGVIENILLAAPDDPRAALDAFAPFEETPFYFDITADLWIAFSKREPDLCLMRLDRLIHFTDTGRSSRMPFFLLRFCIRSAMLLPPAWLARQAETLHRLPGFAEAATPDGGRLAAYDPLKTGPRRAGDELDFLDAFVRLRKSLDAETRPDAASYRRLLNAWCNGDVETAVATWCDIAGDIFNDYVPVSAEGPCITPVMFRLRQSLDELVVRPEAPTKPPAIRWHEWAVGGIMTMTVITLFMGVLFFFVTGISLIFTLLEGHHSPGIGIPAHLLILVLSAAPPTVLAWHVFSPVRRKRLLALLFAPVVIAALKRPLDYTHLDRFFQSLKIVRFVKRFDPSPALRFRVLVFPGSRATPWRELHSRRKVRPPSA